MANEKRKHSDSDDMYVYFHQADDTKGEKIMLKWGDLKKEIIEELLSSFPEKKDDAPASIDPEFLKPAPKLVREEESDKLKNAKSTYKVEFVCLNSCKEGEVRSHTCTACSEEEAIEETKRHCKVIQCDYRIAIGIWKDGLWYSAGDLAVQKPQKAKEHSPFDTYLVKYEYKTHSAVSTDVHAEEFVAIAADKMDAVNKLMKHLGMLNRHFHRLRSVGKVEDIACISGERITMPYSRLTDEQIVAAIDHELNMNARNDTLATDRIERLASRIEFYGRTDKVFAEKHPYWQARVAYLRHGDFPNPGIDRNGETFTAILKECADMIRPPQEKGEPIPVNAED